MGMSISSVSWAEIAEYNPEVFSAIKTHAQMKAKVKIDWEKWLKLKDSGAGFSFSYDIGGNLYNFLEKVLEYNEFGLTYFVPYEFNLELCSYTFPVPSDFWFDEIMPQGWNTPLSIIDGNLFLNRFDMGVSPDYREESQQKAIMYEELEDDEYAYHYIEANLIKSLEEAMPKNIPLVIYC